MHMNIDAINNGNIDPTVDYQEQIHFFRILVKEI